MGQSKNDSVRFWPKADTDRQFQIFSTKLSVIDPKRTSKNEIVVTRKHSIVPTVIALAAVVYLLSLRAGDDIFKILLLMAAGVFLITHGIFQIRRGIKDDGIDAIAGGLLFIAAFILAYFQAL